MLLKHKFTKLMAIPFLAGLLIIVQPVFGQAATSNHTNMSMDMPVGSEETVMPEISSTDPMTDDMPEAAGDSHDQTGTMDEGNHDQAGTMADGDHDQGDAGINWPVISIFAAINGAALVTAAVMRQKKLLTNEVTK